jgi:hypothetical protein
MIRVRLANSVVDRQCHVCAFFRGDEHEVILPFIKAGPEPRTEQCFDHVSAANMEWA